MLYEIIVDSYGDTTYVPTTLGNVLLAAVVLVLLAAALLFARKHSRNARSSAGKLTVKQLTFCALALALGTVLSNVKLFDFPWGGSITLLSMFFICLPGYWFGLGAGIVTAVAYGVLQILIDPYILFPMQLVVDYLLAFGALGLSGLFSNSKNGLMKGYLLGIFGRWVFTTLSGWIFFAAYAWEGWQPLPYSMAYNGIYIGVEGAITVVILAIPAVRNGLGKMKQLALE